jgi:hypothetical protein
VQLTGLPLSASLAAGGFGGCSTGSDLSIECWGLGDYGQLATGTTDNAYGPIPIKL